MLTGFNHLTLATGNLPISTAFYQEVLGFKLLARWETGAYLSLGDLWLCLSSDDVRAQDMQRNYTDQLALGARKTNAPNPQSNPSSAAHPEAQSTPSLAMPNRL
ncbi:VOC family protein [Pseudomonas vanderleydeniana]|uniref:VOC family protein n=1 Tax=Pseudomonas vanderleydeniana TaxID=2745495 RepID=A0A9E6TQ39_9PSED|nr:VOC family protein [Pseudomonas vanderleydeniana]